MPIFDDALAKLTDSHRERVEQCLVLWAANAGWGQLAANIRAECALRFEHFGSLLLDFAQALGRSPALAPEEAWCNACARYELHGAEMPLPQRPSVLGRGSRIRHFAGGISTKRRHVSPAQAERLVRKNAGRIPPVDEEEILRAGTLGGQVIWATFNVADGNADPLAGLPSRMAAVCTALGLGFHADQELLVLTYRSEAPVHGLPLHRPTVADAKSYCYYRPHGDAASCWGYTEPLTPNPEGLRALPEVVHAQVGAAALIFPYQILV